MLTDLDASQPLHTRVASRQDTFVGKGFFPLPGGYVLWLVEALGPQAVF